MGTSLGRRESLEPSKTLLTQYLVCLRGIASDSHIYIQPSRRPHTLALLSDPQLPQKIAFLTPFHPLQGHDLVEEMSKTPHGIVILHPQKIEYGFLDT